MTYVAAHAAGIALLVFVFHATGTLAVRVWRPLASAGPRTGLAPIAVGIALWMYFLMALACVGAYRRGVLIGAVALVAMLGLLPIVGQGFRPANAGPDAAAASFKPRLSLQALAWLAPAVVLAQLFVRTLGPALGWDDMTYHLTLPKLYLEAGGFRQLPFNVYSHWPSNVQLLYGLGLALGDHVFAKLLHLAFLALLTIGIYRVAARAAAPWSGAVAASLLLANDVVLIEAPVAYIDIAVAFFFFMAVVHAIEFRETGSRTELILSGVFCGCVAGSKITGLGSVACVLPLVVLGTLAHHRERRVRQVVRDGALFSACAFALAVPWLLKSYIDTGDPLYPVLWKYFGGIEWSDTLHEQFWTWQNSIGMGRTPRDYLLLPIRVILYGGGGYDHFGAWISKTWIVLLPLTIAFARWVPAARRFLLPAALYFVIWAASSQQSRFLISVLPLLAVATAVTAAWVVEQFAQKLRSRLPQRAAAIAGLRSCAAAVVVLISIAVLGWASRYVRAGSIEAARELFVAPPNLREWTPDPAYIFVRRELPPNAKVLLLNTNHGFFLDRDYVADSFFEASQVNEAITAARTRDGLTRLFGRLGVTHVLVDQTPWVSFPTILWSYLGDSGQSRVVYRTPNSSLSVYELTLESRR